MKNYKYIFLLFCLFPVLSGFANHITARLMLSGTVTDAKTGEPLAGASIYITDDKTGAIADDKGHYTLNFVPPGHHVIEVSFTGYSTLVEHIELKGNTTIDFRLDPVITENQGVIITGVSGATSLRRNPVPVTIVRRQALLQTTSTNIIDALARVPGVTQLSTGPAISKPVIRGLGYNRVVTINDGVRQEGQQWGDEHGIEVDDMSIARAEVLKGPASLAYGSDALAGVINLVTHVPVAEGTIKANLLSNYQSNNRLMGWHGNIAGNNHGFNWNLYGTYKSAGDFRNKFDGRVLNSRFNEKNFGGYIGLNKGWGYSHLIFSRFNQHAGLVEGDRDPGTGRFLLFAGTVLERIATEGDLDARKPFVPAQHVEHNRVISDNNFVVGKSRLKINLAYQQNQRKEFGNPLEPGEKELHFDLETFTYTVQWHLPEKREWHSTIGINGMLQGNENRGEEVLIPEYRLFDAGAFLYTQRFFTKGTISGGVRMDRRSIDSELLTEGSSTRFPEFRKSFTNVSASAGISYEPKNNVTLKFNLARGFRSPSIPELASNGTHEGTNRYEYGDLDLRSETSFQADAGIELDNEHFHINFTPFYNRISDFIFYRKLLAVGGGDSLVNVDGEDIPAFRFNQENATLWGFEFGFDIHPHPLDWLHIENNFSFVRGQFDEQLEKNVGGSDRLPLIPAPRWNTELRGDFKKTGKAIHNLYAKIEMATTFRQDRPFTGYGTETSTSGYTLLNAGIGADFGPKHKILFALHLAVTNIGDVAYQNHLSRLKYAATNPVNGRTGVFNTGRNFSVKLNIPFQSRTR